jgi:hypothetical protein
MVLTWKKKRPEVDGMIKMLANTMICTRNLQVLRGAAA